MGWLFAAFAVIWVVFFFYVIHLNKRQSQLAAEIEGLKRRLPGS
ncbi:MAG: CcmD family protein [Candidatus Krumholzibacteriia bacterium]